MKHMNSKMFDTPFHFRGWIILALALLSWGVVAVLLHGISTLFG